LSTSIAIARGIQCCMIVAYLFDAFWRLYSGFCFVNALLLDLAFARSFLVYQIRRKHRSKGLR
jgi:hypothetical protein